MSDDLAPVECPACGVDLGGVDRQRHGISHVAITDDGWMYKPCIGCLGVGSYLLARHDSPTYRRCQYCGGVGFAMIREADGD